MRNLVRAACGSGHGRWAVVAIAAQVCVGAPPISLMRNADVIRGKWPEDPGTNFAIVLLVKVANASRKP